MQSNTRRILDFVSPNFSHLQHNLPQINKSAKGPWKKKKNHLGEHRNKHSHPPWQIPVWGQRHEEGSCSEFISVIWTQLVWLTEMKHRKHRTGPSDWFTVLCLKQHFISYTLGIQRLMKGQIKVDYIRPRKNHEETLNRLENKAKSVFKRSIWHNYV